MMDLINIVVIHPDKTPHASAPEAFDLLKKVRYLLFLA